MINRWEQLRRRMERALFCEQWAVGVVKAPISSFLDEAFDPKVEWIGQCGRSDFLADAFGFCENGKRLVLAERFTYRGRSRRFVGDQDKARLGRGHITELELDDMGRVVAEKPAIDNGLHMSYPFTIFDRGSWYCVVEEVSGGGLNLYQRNTSGAWRLLQQVFPFPVVDPVIFRFDGLWWMFGTGAENPNDGLQIWFADDLLGTWSAHPSSPFPSGAYNTRSGGTPFLWQGHLYRPTQDCTNTYGGAVVLKRINALTRTEFREEPFRTIRPLKGTPFQDGLHTLSSFGDWTLLDAKRRVILPRVAAQTVLLMLTRFLKAQRESNDPSTVRDGSDTNVTAFKEELELGDCEL